MHIFHSGVAYMISPDREGDVIIGDHLLTLAFLSEVTKNGSGNRDQLHVSYERGEARLAAYCRLGT
jgi:hypothetical protein